MLLPSVKVTMDYCLC